jgi:hypothetical protein
MSYRGRLTLLAIVFVCSSDLAWADSAVITSGFISMSWDGSVSGIDLQGDGTHLSAENVQSPPSTLQVGQIADLGSTVGTSTMNHPVSATVNGTTYDSVWVKGRFSVVATPFTVPSEPAGASPVFSTPMTMMGEFFGYSDQAMTNQVFAMSLSGSGVATIGPMRAISSDTYLLNCCALVYTFTTSVPAPWESNDIGSPGQPGVASVDGTTFYIAGSGGDIWWTDDHFQFVSRPLDGDGEIVARVWRVSDTNAYAKAGVMLRSSLASSAPDVILDLRPSNDIEFMSRPAAGAMTNVIAGAMQAPPDWLRLTRTGTTVTAAVSADGASWTAVGSTSFPAGPSLVGLAVTSHDDSALNTSVFDRVTVTAAAPPPAPDIVIYANDIPASAIHGVWTKTSDGSAAAGVALTTPDNGSPTISEPLGAPDDYVDVTFTAVPNTPYTLWLRVMAASDSKWNDSVWVQFSDAFVDGEPIYPISSTSGLLVNLATDFSAASLNHWGWQNGAYWLSQPTAVMFDDNPMHTLRIQLREDGVTFDQIVLSPVTYATTAPGPVGGDNTIVPK